MEWLTSRCGSCALSAGDGTSAGGCTGSVVRGASRTEGPAFGLSSAGSDGRGVVGVVVDVAAGNGAGVCPRELDPVACLSCSSWLAFTAPVTPVDPVAMMSCASRATSARPRRSCAWSSVA